jgi:predicted dehydrogenase
MTGNAHCLLVGAGQLGSRYLQGLACIDRQLKITVIDPSSSSLDLARQRLAEASPATVHEVSFSTSLDDAPKQLNLALVVTPAHCRPEVVDVISAQHEVSAWILEKVLAQSSQKVDQIERALVGHSRVWVNTPRRLMSWHQEIKSQMLAIGPSALRVRMAGGNWGLACNAIHLIDLVSWWTGASVDVVDTRRLGDWQPSKRSGFQEVFGSLMVNFSDGSTLELICNQSDAAPRIKVETPEGIWLIDELAGKAVGPSGKEIAGQLSFQSAFTAPLVEQILTSGRCELPSLADSAAQHRPFLDALLQHWNHSQSRQDFAVSIT